MSTVSPNHTVAGYSALARLRVKIENRTARLAIIGLGYVGLPVACAFASAGFEVLGVEQNQERVSLINQGISPIGGNEPGLADLVSRVTPAKLRATSDYNEINGSNGIRPCDVVLIAVETPVEDSDVKGVKVPRYDALRAALHSLGASLRFYKSSRASNHNTGVLVIIESTLAPGTMNQLVEPLLVETSGLAPEQDFYLAHCPERVMPGKLLQNLRSINRVVGGMTPEIAETAAALYRHIVEAELDITDCTTAELVKTVENAYRDVQIAFANEVALICEAAGSDVWQVRSLVNKSPYRQMHLPGAGVGGHCIPKDPWLLAYSVRENSIISNHEVPLHVIPAARLVNDGMPRHMVELTRSGLAEAGIEISAAKVLVMGCAYLENSDDIRNSPSIELVKYLQESGADYLVHDPFVYPYRGDLIEMARGCDAVIVMVRHQPYLQLDLHTLKAILHHPVLIDGRHVFDGTVLRSDGWIYRGIGQSFD